MAVTIEIHKPNLHQTLTVQEIAKMKNLTYGVSDSNYRLEWWKTGAYTILFDSNCIGRGFDVSFDTDKLIMSLPLPTTNYDIRLFYTLVAEICNANGIPGFFRDEEYVPVEKAWNFVEGDINICRQSKQQLWERINEGKDHRLYIFGALNPIALGREEVKEICRGPDGLDFLLDRLQQKDAFYAGAHYYKRNDESIYGIYAVNEKTVTIFPERAKSPFVSLYNVDYYVILPDNHAVPFDAFIRNVKAVERYDREHIVIKLTEEEIFSLTEKFTVDHITKMPQKGNYLGTVIDSGYNHLRKIRRMSLETEEFSAFNHLAVFIRWSREKGLLKEPYASAVTEMVAAGNDLRKFMDESPLFKGQIRPKYFTEKGEEFVRGFYYFNSDTGYPACVDKFSEKTMGKKLYNCREYKDEAYLFMKYDEDYYTGLSVYIEKEWKKFNKKKK